MTNETEDMMYFGEELYAAMLIFHRIKSARERRMQTNRAVNPGFYYEQREIERLGIWFLLSRCIVSTADLAKFLGCSVVTVRKIKYNYDWLAFGANKLYAGSKF